MYHATLKPFYERAQHITLCSQGVSIVLSVWEKDSEAVTVLFYPGTMASPHMYLLFLYELFGYGCNIVAVHPLSHGLSSRIKKSFVFDDILLNGYDAQEWARGKFSGPLVVCGHSQGGILALAHALDNPHIAASFPVGTLLPHEDDAGSVTRFASLLQHKEVLLRYLGAFSSYAPRLPLHFMFYLQLHRIVAGASHVIAPRKQCRQTYPLCFVHSLFTKDLSLAQQEGHIHCPVCVITARDDALFPLVMMQGIVDTLVAPYKECFAIQGGGHMAIFSTDYAKIIAAHVAGRCAGFGLPLHMYS